MGWAEEGDGESMVEGVDRMEGLMIVEDSIRRRDVGKGLGKGRSSGDSVGDCGSIDVYQDESMGDKIGSGGDWVEWRGSNFLTSFVGGCGKVLLGEGCEVGMCLHSGCNLYFTRCILDVTILENLLLQ